MLLFPLFHILNIRRTAINSVAEFTCLDYAILYILPYCIPTATYSHRRGRSKPPAHITGNKAWPGGRYMERQYPM